MSLKPYQLLKYNNNVLYTKDNKRLYGTTKQKFMGLSNFFCDIFGWCTENAKPINVNTFLAASSNSTPVTPEDILEMPYGEVVLKAKIDHALFFNELVEVIELFELKTKLPASFKHELLIAAAQDMRFALWCLENIETICNEGPYSVNELKKIQAILILQESEEIQAAYLERALKEKGISKTEQPKIKKS